jgi:phage terminase large subunit GpA-like protein
VAWAYGVRAVRDLVRAGGEIFKVPEARSIDPRHTGTKASKYGVKIYLVGTERAKDHLLGWTAEGGRIKLCDRGADGRVSTGRGAGRMHWYAEVRDDFYEQLADSEVKVPNAKAGGKLVWTLKAGRRNEALDCAVYCEHAARALSLHTWNEARWSARESALQAVDLFSVSAARDVAPEPVPAKPPEAARRAPARNDFGRDDWML